MFELYEEEKEDKYKKEQASFKNKFKDFKNLS